MKTIKIKEHLQDLPAYEAAARAHERDNGRRGEPLPGCDCVRCFGRCSIDRDAAVRELLARRGEEAPELGFGSSEDGVGARERSRDYDGHEAQIDRILISRSRA